MTEQTWTLDEYGDCLDPQTIRITEFRGNGRQRYMVRERDPAFVLEVLPGTTRWSDYDGDEIYGDYVVDDETGDVTNLMAYLPGVGQMDLLSGEIVYFHGDQIGSVRAVSDQQSTVSGTMVYTAFAEQVYADGTVGTRYQYAGAWGYETSNRTDVLAELGWLHVGHRYYDPSTGRFLQRDPIGVRGGLNVYNYARNNPLRFVDPLGLDTVVIHWREGAGGSEWGHTAIMTQACVYISFVPTDWANGLWGSDTYPKRTFEDDLDKYDIPHEILVIEGLDEDKIVACWRKKWEKEKWRVDRNCIDCCEDCLRKGGRKIPPKDGPITLPPSGRRRIGLKP